MRLIRPSTQILTPLDGKYILQFIESVARTCYKSEDKITDDSAEKMIKTLIAKHHEAMIEFFDITVKFTCDRGVSHEIVRHRIASYAQESTRYCNYSKDKFGNQITFIIPSWIDDIQEGFYSIKLGTNGRLFQETDPDLNDREDLNSNWFWAMANNEIDYNKLIAGGWQPQQARAVLPNSLKTEIIMKTNIREWRHFFELRCSQAAHPQMREVAIPLLHEIKSKIPILFDDLNF